MAEWISQNIMLTTKGAAAISKVQSGIGKLTITKVVASEQYVPESTLRGVTSLSVENLPLTIIDRHEVPDGGSVIQVQLSNLNLNNPFIFNELGVFATHSDNPSEEFLYIIAQVDEGTGDRIPLYSATPVTATYDIYLYNVGADNVQITVSSSGLVTYEALNEACGMVKRSTSYAEEDIRYSSSLPIPYYLKCKVAGTTSSSSFVIPSDIEEGDTITDGTVVWEVLRLTSNDELQTAVNALSDGIVSTNTALAESTGYGIVSGCEPSINGLTVTVSAGVIHTADGRRIEVPEQSITLDAADATNPRTDVVYLDKYGKIAKLTGEIGTSTAPGLTEAVIKVGEIAIKAGAVAGAITASYNHYKTATSTYHNVSMMRQDRTLMPGMVAHTLGYYELNDGGGAVYIIRSKKENDVDDGGSTIVLDNGNVAELIVDGAVRAEIFGAHGDGVSDDSDALQKMLDYGGNIVLNKNKKYAFSTTLKISKFSNIDFSLAEMTYTGDDIGIIITGEGFASHKSDIGNITNIYLHAPNANKAISLRKCIKTRITNARIYDFGKIAVSIDVASYEAYLDDIRLVAKVKSGTVGFSGIASDMNFGSLYGLNVETFWSCNGGGYNVDFIHAWCANLNYFSEGLSTDVYNAWYANTSLLKIDTYTSANSFFAVFNYVYADTYYNVINWDSYANNIKINHLGVYGCAQIATFGNTDSTPAYISHMHINHVTIDKTSLLTDENYYPNISFINGSESKKVINQDINGTTYQFVLNKLKIVVKKFTGTYYLAIQNVEWLPYYIGTENYGKISETRIPYFNDISKNYIYDIKNAETTEKYVFIPIRIIAITFGTKFRYQV